MLFERVGDIFVVVHLTEDPTDAEWEHYASAVHEALHGTPPLTGVLVTTRGAAPNAGQRRSLVEAVGKKPVSTCVCSDSRVVRGVITALHWLYASPTHALPYDDVERGLKMLNVPLALYPAAKQLVARLQSELSGHV
jgi:hypothetical protein